MRRLVALFFLFLVSCARPVITSGIGECQWIYSACVLYSPDAPYRIDDARLKQVFRIAARYWGTDLAAIRGYNIIFHGYEPLFVGSPIWGYTINETKRIGIVYEYPLCPEAVLVHEWGHVGGGDPMHLDPRYDDARILSELSSIPGCGDAR